MLEPMDQAVEDKPRIDTTPPPGTPPGGREARRSPSPPPRPAPGSSSGARRPRERRRGLSPLTLRILAVNVLALLILAIGLLYLDRYQQRLTEGEFDALEVQARLIAGALGEGATEVSDTGEPSLDQNVAQALVRRLAEPTSARVRLFDAQGGLVVDSQLIVRQGGIVQVLPLPEAAPTNPISRTAISLYEWVFNWLPGRDEFAPFPAGVVLSAEAVPEALYALGGESAIATYAGNDRHLVLSVGMPVQRYRQVVGALAVSRSSHDIDEAVRSVRLDILAVFVCALAVTVLMSIYLAGTIARPVRRLALAAERVGLGRSRAAIPDFSHRGDEIGDLSIAVRDMTEALSQRLVAIESFAADVAHEIKNPLTSLRSAIETVTRVADPAQQRRLMGLVLEDIQRLDRLITDIASASRLDAELARAEPAPVELGKLLSALVEVHHASIGADQPALVLDADARAGLTISGIEDRLVQVFRNLIANALSFSPPGGTIRLNAVRIGPTVRVSIEDDGPGIPAGKEQAIFDRFYSERPKAEKFGIHSGLGLSISKQIVEAHAGSIRAENRVDVDGTVRGARFVVQFPALDRPAA
jgi:two-component system sensor histidine kinase ChvG